MKREDLVRESRGLFRIMLTVPSHRSWTENISACEHGCMSTHWDSMGHQGVGVHDGDQLVQQVRLGLEQLRGQFPHHLLQLLCSKTRSPIPCFRLPPKMNKMNITFRVDMKQK